MHFPCCQVQHLAWGDIPWPLKKSAAAAAAVTGVNAQEEEEVAVQQVDGRVHEEVPRVQEEEQEEEQEKELFFFDQPLQLLPPCGKVRLTSAARPSMHLPEGAAVDNAGRAGEAGPGAGAGAVEGARRGARDEARDGVSGGGQVQARNPAPVYAYYDTMHQTIKPLGSVHAPVIRVQGEREPRLTFWTEEQTMALLQGLNALDTEMKVKTQGRWQAVARLMAMQRPAFVMEAVRACHVAGVWLLLCKEQQITASGACTGRVVARVQQS